jgi:hypothetical protein
MAPTSKGKYYSFIQKNVDCITMFESSTLDQSLLEESRDQTYKTFYTRYLRIFVINSGGLYYNAFNGFS